MKLSLCLSGENLRTAHILTTMQHSPSLLWELQSTYTRAWMLPSTWNTLTSWWLSSSHIFSFQSVIAGAKINSKIWYFAQGWEQSSLECEALLGLMQKKSRQGQLNKKNWDYGICRSCPRFSIVRCSFFKDHLQPCPGLREGSCSHIDRHCCPLEYNYIGHDVVTSRCRWSQTGGTGVEREGCLPT